MTLLTFSLSLPYAILTIFVLTLIYSKNILEDIDINGF